MDAHQTYRHHIQRHGARFVAELMEFIRFPSVSSDPQRAVPVKRCARWLAEHLGSIGMERVRIHPTSGHPIVYADWLHAPGRPSVLLYGHYDVQPPDPVQAWHSPPFEPVIRGKDLYGRGASDDKGQMFVHLKAIETLLHADSRLPVNVRCVFEGEEEIGSTHLGAFFREKESFSEVDLAVVSDLAMAGPGRPAICYGLRGALSLELEVNGHERELHAGLFGGAVHNPLQGLCEIISTLHEPNGRLAIPGFYQRVRRWSDTERLFMVHNGPSDMEILKRAQARHPWGEPDYSLYERITIRPSLTVSGLSGGYQGPGPQAIIPPRASARIDCRLVPDQDPHEIDRLIRRHIARTTPPTLLSSVRTLLMARPTVLDRSHPAMDAAAAALARGFGRAPVFLRSGGTIPVVSLLQETLGAPVVLMGFGLPDDCIHGPNEKFHLPNFFRAIHTCMHFLGAAAKIPQPYASRLPRRVRVSAA